MIHRLNVFLLSLIIIFSQTFIISNAYAGIPQWQIDWLRVEKQNEALRAKAKLAKMVNEAGSKQTITAEVETSVTASKVGGAMFKRVAHYAKNPGVQMLGVMAVTQLIEAIGWVMEEGSYVKIKPPEAPPADQDPTIRVLWFGNLSKKNFSTYQAAAVDECPIFRAGSSPTGVYSFPNSSQVYAQCAGGAAGSSAYATISSKINPIYDPNAVPSNEPTTIFLTPDLLGAAMIGEGYSDPVDPSKDAAVNTGVINPSVPDAYQFDPTGIGNELNLELQALAEASPNQVINNSTTVNNTATTVNNTTGETGTTTGQTELPPFCDYAMTFCEWMDWTKTDTEILPEDNQVPINDLEMPILNTTTFNSTAGCPAPKTVPIQFATSTQNLEISYEPICQFSEKWSFVAPLIGFLSGAMIIIGVGRKGEDQDV